MNPIQIPHQVGGGLCLYSAWLSLDKSVHTAQPLSCRHRWNPHSPGPFLPVCSLVIVSNFIRTAPCNLEPTGEALLPPKYAHQTISMITVALSILSLIQHLLCANCMPGSLPGARGPGMDPALMELIVQLGIMFMRSWVCDGSP